MAIETIRTIKNGHIKIDHPGVRGEVEFVRKFFTAAACWKPQEINLDRASTTQ
ncbi:MAG TPA: hypothetical protein VIN05_02880 [Roseovarius sp.]